MMAEASVWLLPRPILSGNMFVRCVVGVHLAAVILCAVVVLTQPTFEGISRESARVLDGFLEMTTFTLLLCPLVLIFGIFCQCVSSRDAWLGLAAEAVICIGHVIALLPTIS